MILYLITDQDGVEVKRGLCQIDTLESQREDESHTAWAVDQSILDMGPILQRISGDWVVFAKSEMPLTIQRNLITGIPLGARAIINGEMDIVEDGEIVFVADVEGVTSVDLSHPNYVRAMVEVDTGP